MSTNDVFSKRQLGDDFWAQQLAQAATVAGIIFPKEGTTKVRLVWKAEDELPYLAVDVVFRGRHKNKYLFLAMSDGKPTGVMVTKTVLKGILTLGQQGYDLFDPAEGYGLQIIRSGTGMTGTSYSVLPSKKPVPLTQEDADQLTSWSLQELARNYAALQNQRGAESGEAEEGEDW